MRVAIILNGISLKKKFFYQKILPQLQSSFLVTVFETKSSSDAVTFAHEAAENLFDVILAAGGDGTLNQVLNGIFLKESTASNFPILGLIPLGSGNDFARSIVMKPDGKLIATKLSELKVVFSDVGKIYCKNSIGEDMEAYFINVADVGMGPEVVEKVIKVKKFLSAGVAYYSSIISTFFTYNLKQVSIKADSWTWQGKLRTLAIANARFFGHGLCAGPDAKIDDGILDSLIAGDISVLEFIWHSETLKKAKKIRHKKVHYSKSNRFEVSSKTKCQIEADGELVGYLPAVVEVIPNAIRILV